MHNAVFNEQVKIKNAVKTACEEFSEESKIQSVVICGDENITLY